VQNSSARIHGTIYELADRKLLAKFDEYEGFDPAQRGGSLFVRRRVFVQLASGEHRRCWVYLYNRPVEGAPKIVSGIYLPKSTS
jgi:gamma-glutamylcyclotransferase (GGCT)/AIG2-like uncharacterized protein YtfP